MATRPWFWLLSVPLLHLSKNLARNLHFLNLRITAQFSFLSMYSFPFTYKSPADPLPSSGGSSFLLVVLYFSLQALDRAGLHVWWSQLGSSTHFDWVCLHVWGPPDIRQSWVASAGTAVHTGLSSLWLSSSSSWPRCVLWVMDEAQEQASPWHQCHPHQHPIASKQNPWLSSESGGKGETKEQRDKGIELQEGVKNGEHYRIPSHYWTRSW